MKETLAVVEKLHADGIIGPYAIGGAVGAAFYIEPVATLDVDIFVLFEPAPVILTLTPIYEACAKLGYRAEGDAIQIEGWPVQFLPATQPLVAEAVREAVTREAEGSTTRVMTAEHLMAIALQTGRAKDHARLVMFVEAGIADRDRCVDISFHATHWLMRGRNSGIVFSSRERRTSANRANEGGRAPPLARIAVAGEIGNARQTSRASRLVAQDARRHGEVNGERGCWMRSQ